MMEENVCVGGNVMEVTIHFIDVFGHLSDSEKKNIENDGIEVETTDKVWELLEDNVRHGFNKNNQIIQLFSEFGDFQGIKNTHYKIIIIGLKKDKDLKKFELENVIFDSSTQSDATITIVGRVKKLSN